MSTGDFRSPGKLQLYCTILRYYILIATLNPLFRKLRVERSGPRYPVGLWQYRILQWGSKQNYNYWSRSRFCSKINSGYQTLCRSVESIKMVNDDTQVEQVYIYTWCPLIPSDTSNLQSLCLGQPSITGYFTARTKLRSSQNMLQKRWNVLIILPKQLFPACKELMLTNWSRLKLSFWYIATYY